MIKKIIGIIILTFTILTINAKEKENPFLDDIREINELVRDSKEYFSDEDKLRANELVLSKIKALAKNRKSFDYPMDSLVGISFLESKDGIVRLFTWNIYFEDLTHKCFGLIQYHPNKRTNVVFELKDFYDHYATKKRKFPSHAEWYGAVYYDIVEKKVGKNTLYTLMGWRGCDALTQQKVIETLSFDRRNLPRFGGRKFRVNKKYVSRLVYTYSAKTMMRIGQNPSKELIVIDHLSPSNPKFIGQYQYYGPDLSYDALEFRGSKWYMMENIDPTIAVSYTLMHKRDSTEQPSQGF